VCLSRPAEVVAVEGASATVRLNGQLVRVDTRAVGPVAAGDRLLVHAGLAIERLDPKAAAELEELLAEWERLATSDLDEVTP
jgi:hydrogenase expression/formation protein HypC